MIVSGITTSPDNASESAAVIVTASSSSTGFGDAAKDTVGLIGSLIVIVFKDSLSCLTTIDGKLFSDIAT